MSTATVADKTYNGWANYETWNVALWLQNDECLYNVARHTNSYAEAIEVLLDLNCKATPDGVKWNSAKIDHQEINEMIKDPEF